MLQQLTASEITVMCKIYSKYSTEYYWNLTEVN